MRLPRDDFKKMFKICLCCGNKTYAGDTSELCPQPLWRGAKGLVFLQHIFVSQNFVTPNDFLYLLDLKNVEIPNNFLNLKNFRECNKPEYFWELENIREFTLVFVD